MPTDHTIGALAFDRRPAVIRKAQGAVNDVVEPDITVRPGAGWTTPVHAGAVEEFLLSTLHWSPALVKSPTFPAPIKAAST